MADLPTSVPATAALLARGGYIAGEALATSDDQGAPHDRLLDIAHAGGLDAAARD